MRTMDLGFNIKLTPEESEVFIKLKNKIASEYGLEAAENDRIYRFLKDRDFDLNKTEHTLREHFKWRKLNGVDKLIEEYDPPEVLRKHHPATYIGFDKDNSAVTFIGIGNFDARGILKAVTAEEVLKYSIYMWEYSKVKIQERSKLINEKILDRVVVIADFEGLSFFQISGKRIIEAYMLHCKAYIGNYPEQMKMCYCINTSLYFNMMFNLLKPLLSAAFLKRVKVYGKSGWQEALQEYISPDTLPVYLGGNRTDEDGNPLCPSIINHGGPVSKKYYLDNKSRETLKGQPGVKFYVLKRRSQLRLPITLPEAKCLVEWDIETEDHDIGFGIFYKDENAEVDEEPVPLVPNQRIDCHLLCETNTLICEKSGIYTFVLDNTYSVLRSKNIYYRIKVGEHYEKKTLQ